MINTNKPMATKSLSFLSYLNPLDKTRFKLFESFQKFEGEHQMKIGWSLISPFFMVILPFLSLYITYAVTGSLNDIMFLLIFGSFSIIFSVFFWSINQMFRRRIPQEYKRSVDDFVSLRNSLGDVIAVIDPTKVSFLDMDSPYAKENLVIARRAVMDEVQLMTVYYNRLKGYERQFLKEERG